MARVEMVEVVVVVVAKLVQYLVLAGTPRSTTG